MMISGIKGEKVLGKLRCTVQTFSNKIIARRVAVIRKREQDMDVEKEDLAGSAVNAECTRDDRFGKNVCLKSPWLY